MSYSSIWSLVSTCDVMLSGEDVGPCQYISSTTNNVPKDDQCYVPHGYGNILSVATEELLKMPRR